MNGIWTLAAAVLSFFITYLSGKFLIPYLHRLKYGQTILEIGPSWHKNKQGTPTMGGLMFIIGILISSSIITGIYYFYYKDNIYNKKLNLIKIFAGLFMALCYGLIGFLDDYIKVVKKRNLGLTARQKLFFQFSASLIYLFIIYFAKKSAGLENLTSFKIPFLGTFDFKIFYWIISSIMIVGIVNASNLTDGIDGLNGSVTFFNSLFLMIICGIMGMIGLGISAASLAGGCLGFLIWNFYPAKVFMGDTGSLFLGGIICALAYGIDYPLLLVPIGFVYLLEMFSVILQVLYFKITKGKRLFKMSPIHHHFEMSGWSETKICLVFSLLAIIGGTCALILAVHKMRGTV